MRARRTLAASGVGLLVAMGVAAWASPAIPVEPADPPLQPNGRVGRATPFAPVAGRRYLCMAPQMGTRGAASTTVSSGPEGT